MRRISEGELCKILDLHALWLCGDPNGERADLSDVYLVGADLKSENLKGANLSRSDLKYANLHGADLQGADLRGACLCNADLQGADLRNADLRGATLYGAYLRDAESITTVRRDADTAFLQLQCPEKGQYTGYKKLRRNLIAELAIPEHAKRSSATTRKCRASEAIVVSITDLSGERSYTRGTSMHDAEFRYVVGKTVVVQDFCDDRWIECAAGIHHFITREEAVHYNG